MLKKDEFSLQVFKEYESGNYSLLECIEIIRETHGYEPHEVKKYLTNNLFQALQDECQNNKTVAPSIEGKLDKWLK